MANNAGIQGTLGGLTGQCSGGQTVNSSMNTNSSKDEYYLAYLKSIRAIWMSIGIFLVLISVAVAVYVYYVNKHSKKSDVVQNQQVPSAEYLISPDKEIGSIITTSEGSKVIFQPELKLSQMPENQKFKDTVFFTNDGSAVLFASNIYSGVGDDILWRSNGKWFAILGNPKIKKDDFRITRYINPATCECPTVTIVSQ